MATKPRVESGNVAGSAQDLARIALAVWVMLTYLNVQSAETALLLPPGAITFDTQAGPYGTIYTGHTEGLFTITPTVGVWYESMQYGNPVPSIYTGPPGVPERSVIKITSAGGLFSFGSLDFSSNNGSSTYSIQGSVGATQVFDQVGVMQNLTPGFFTKLWSNDARLVDALLIDVTPGAGTTSLNLDNIALAPVPEPGALRLLAAALGAFFFSRIRRPR
jgi:hypothetical protein